MPKLHDHLLDGTIPDKSMLKALTLADDVITIPATVLQAIYLNAEFSSMWNIVLPSVNFSKVNIWLEGAWHYKDFQSWIKEFITHSIAVYSQKYYMVEDEIEMLKFILQIERKKEVKLLVKAALLGPMRSTIKTINRMR